MANATPLRKKITRIAVLGVMATIPVVLVLSGSGGRTKVAGPQLISIQPLPEEGVMCETPGETGGSALAAAMEQQRSQMQLASLMAAPQQQVASAPPPPANAAKAAVAARKPLTMIRDNFAAYSALAIDPSHNEIVMVDENQF